MAIPENCLDNNRCNGTFLFFDILDYFNCATGRKKNEIWALFALVVAYGIVEPESYQTKTNTKIIILAYKGNGYSLDKAVRKLPVNYPQIPHILLAYQPDINLK